LPKPVGLFACNDVRGQQVLAQCGEMQIAVPKEIAVLGVDNDDVQCEFSNPSLSSIDPNAVAIGYEAACLLQRLFDGRPAPTQKVTIMPLGAVARRSTDVLAIADRDVAEAVQFVREHAFDGMSLSTMVTSLPFSRSTLERWFRQVLGHSLADEVQRVRVERCAELLVTSALTVERIADLSGFTHVETMSRVFRRVKGVPPGQFRLESRTDARNKS
jgi:LacI family transcriptional regulator